MSLCKRQRGAKREMDSVSLLTLASKENDSKDGRRSGSAAGLRGAGSEGCWEGAGVGRWLLDIHCGLHTNNPQVRKRPEAGGCIISAVRCKFIPQSTIKTIKRHFDAETHRQSGTVSLCT